MEELQAWGGSRVLLQGGVNPYLKLDYYTGLLGYLKEHYPDYRARRLLAGRGVEHRAHREASAGRDPACAARGGDGRAARRRRGNPGQPHAQPHRAAQGDVGELDRGRAAGAARGPDDLGDDGLRLWRGAGGAGAVTDRLRELQDESLAYNGNGFTSFICWSYQPDNTAMGGDRASGDEYLRMVSFARLMLDNFPNISASWPSQGPELAGRALHSGANDFGSTMMEENVVSAAGADVGTCMTVEQIQENIRAQGFRPAKRDSDYHILELFG